MPGRKQDRLVPAVKVLLTGTIGSGKSTVVTRALGLLGATRLAGFRTRSIREGGNCTGFLLEDWSGGGQFFARPLHANPTNPGCFAVDLEVFQAQGVRLLQAAGADDLLVIDELGVMEQAAPDFGREVAAACSRSRRVLLVVQRRALDFWWPHLARSGFEHRVELDLANRDILPGRIAEWLG